LLGRSFVHPVYDVMLIGGGLSLLFIPFVYYSGLGASRQTAALLPWIILLSNSTHFAASTVRLYTKPGARQALPFVTLGLPAVTFAVLTLCVFRADLVGRYVQWLYLTWSPYHYAAQAYGLAVMYSYRSGCQLPPLQKRLLWWCALLPFLRALVVSTDEHLMSWIFPDAAWVEAPQFAAAVDGLVAVLGLLAIATPLLLYLGVRRSGRGPLPLISLLAIISNAAWFVLFPLVQGFLWVTVFHGLQYLAIVVIFHARDQLARPANRHGPLWHAFSFYGLSLLLGYGLFHCWPGFYEFLGFGMTESVLMVVAAINIHHFIVDAYIWRLRPGDSNRTVVESDAAAPV
jgi:hypothetical protein